MSSWSDTTAKTVKKFTERAIVISPPTNAASNRAVLIPMNGGQVIHNLRADIERMTEFPVMPELAQRIMALRSEPSARELAAVVELDPGIAGQLVRYASSPLFAYGGKLNSIRDAISRVLGVERAMDIALGAAAGKPFRGPAGGGGAAGP